MSTMSDIRSAEDVAQEALGCERAVVEPGRTASGAAYCAEHHYGWLSDVDMCPRQEKVAELIRARDVEVRADERKKVARLLSGLLGRLEDGLLSHHRAHEEVAAIKRALADPDV